MLTEKISYIIGKLPEYYQAFDPLIDNEKYKNKIKTGKKRIIG